jgi:Flp pilus assembly protein TadG
MAQIGHTHKSLQRYLKNTAGNVTITAALAALPLFMTAGAAIDYISMTRDISAFQAATDSAVMAVVSSDKARITGLSGTALAQRMTELETIASNYLEANYTARNGGDGELSLDLEIDGQKVLLTATHEVEAPWLGAFDLFGPEITVTSEVKKAAQPVELVMVMDTTGSMGTTYMAQARTAARNLLNKVYGGTPAEQPESEYIRVGLVPFSGAVRLDTAGFDFDMDWIDTTGAAPVSKLNFSNSSWHNYMAWTQLSNRPWNGCVEARYGDYATDDTRPIDGSTLFTPYFAPDEPTFSGSTSSPNNFLNSYISNSGSPNEQTGISTSTSSSNWLARQENVNKYINKSITAESSSDYGPWFNCAKSKLVSLTHNRSKVEAGITAMTASGSTVIPEGIAWGWRALSPTEPLTRVQGTDTIPDADIAPYNSARWQKIMVVMTDGENDVLSNGNQINSLNGTWYSAYGRGKEITLNRFGTTTASQTSAALNENMIELCDNIKEQGVTIYTVAFRVNSSTVQNRLKACASTEAHYSYAANGVALAAVFDHIGENVANTNIFLSK